MENGDPEFVKKFFLSRYSKPISNEHFPSLSRKASYAVSGDWRF